MSLTDIFFTVCEMSAGGALMVLVVLIARPFIKKAKPAVCLLWAAVFLRLVIPFTMQNTYSVVPEMKLSAETVPARYVDGTEDKWCDEIIVNVGASDINISDSLRAPHTPVPKYDTISGGRIKISEIFAIIWLAGTVTMGVLGVLSYIRLSGRLKNTKLLKDNIYQCDGIDNAFICGIFKPKIYIPEGTSDKDMGYIILHERAHIRRGDNIAKIIMYIALCIHWFNPLVWLTFRLCERDMELYCDSRAAKNFTAEQRADYCQALVNIQNARASAFTICFGESDVKQRVKSLITYKKLGIIGGIFSVLITAAVLIMLTGHSRIPAKERIGIDKIDYTVSFELNGESVTYGSASSEDIASFGGKIGKFGKDFYALDLEKVTDDPMKNVHQSAKFSFGQREMTICRGEDISGETVCTLISYHIKLGGKERFIISEKQCQLLFDDIADLFDYEDSIGEHDASAIEDITKGKYFKIEHVFHGRNYDYTELFSEEGRTELMNLLPTIKYTPLDKKGLTLSVSDELNFYDEWGVKTIRILSAITPDHRYIDCVSVGDKLYRIDKAGSLYRIMMYAGERILAAEYTLLREDKFDGFTLTVGDKSAEYPQGAMEDRTGMEGPLHTLKYTINKASGALCNIEEAESSNAVIHLDCKTGDKTDSIILSSAPCGVHTRYFMTVIVNAEHNGVDVGKYCYELTEGDYMKIVTVAGETIDNQ